jgi:hypothetical protein
MDNEKGRARAEEVGYTVKQHDVRDGTPIDASWRGKAPRECGENVSDHKAAEEDARMLEAHRKIKAIMEEDGPPQPQQRQPFSEQSYQGLSMADLMDGLSQNDLASIADGMQDMAQHAAVNLVHQGYQGEPNEASLLSESMAGRPRPQDGTWKTEKAMARLKGSNKTVPVWQIVDESTGMKLPTPYRIQAPAERIATILNTNNGAVNDSRIRNINEAYKTHVNLMKNIRSYQKMLTEDPDVSESKVNAKIRQLRYDLEGVNAILGV